MNLIEEAKLIEETEKNLEIVLQGALRRGLNSLNLLKILTILNQDLLTRLDAELCLKENK